MARILVSGGSLGGLMAANALLRAGHDVTVLERSPRSLEGRGAGIVTHESLREALRQCGAVVDETLGVPVQSRVVLDARGEAECRWEHPQVLTSWGRLYALLRAALPAANHRLGAAVAGVEQTEAGVRVRLAGGESLAADLLVAADGIRSTIRAQLAPAVQPQYAGYIAWRGVCDEASLSRRTRETLFDHFGFGLPEGEQMIGYPVAGADDSVARGQRRWNFVWYRPVAPGAELAGMLTDADGVHYPDGIAPQQVSWRHIAAMRQAARDKLAPQFAEIAEKTAVPFLQPIYDLVSANIAFGRVALLGDAAYVARPHVGMGVAKAGDDAMVLTRCIAELGASPAALRRYAQLRQPVCVGVVQRARRLGAYMEAQQRGAAVQRSADEVMRQTAIDPSLFDTEESTPRAARA
ncbi:MAG: FAD-dependent monooxygenase [Piscinibacter sp.]|uniref:FAD binding domain-containing protein n=1 Tax=Piscinibacter sp. TaxID=1903157 RepID=UPI003D128F17